MPSQPNPLTESEADILALLARGYSRKKIAEELVLSPNTIQWHLKNIYSKVGAHNKDEASAWYWANTTQNG
jgi:LuxR family maltose regulon positive regulatory protein